MHYDVGAHHCNPKGDNIKYSSTIYINKHMKKLGLKYYINMNILRYERAENMRKHNLAIHYTRNIDNITI